MLSAPSVAGAAQARELQFTIPNRESKDTVEGEETMSNREKGRMTAGRAGQGRG